MQRLFSDLDQLLILFIFYLTIKLLCMGGSTSVSTARVFDVRMKTQWFVRARFE